MSLQFIIGNSGAGKSVKACEEIIRKGMEHPDRRYYVIVPEQFTMQTQKTLVEMHPRGGILNIDVLSFERLAYRVLGEVGGDTRQLLEETGKNMVLQKLVQRKEEDLTYLKNQMKKAGYLDEVKSLISEFMQYEIREEELDKMLQEAEDKPLLHMKLKDVSVLYDAFREYLSGHYMTSEEVLEILVKEIPFSEKLKGSEVLLDGYTGFTPVQHKVIQELLAVCRKVTVTVTMDVREDVLSRGKPHQLFYMSHKMICNLAELTREIEESIKIAPGVTSRFSHAPALEFLEQNIFRYRKKIFRESQEEICLFSAGNPQKETEEVARRILRLVREKNYHYGEIAVITGDLEEYGSIARQVFRSAGIPFFIDEKHSIMMNPFLEYLRAAMEMAVQGFSYESVFRYLRCGMSDITREEADLLENYVIALGIRGVNRWKEKWVRIYRGMEPETIEKLNEIREKFVEETEILRDCFSGKKRTVLEYCQGLYAFIVKSKIQEKLKVQEAVFQQNGDKAMEKEYAQIYGIVMDLLDKAAEILGEETATPEEFRQILETGMTQAKVALIPPSIDQVLVGDMERTRLKDIRALFFVGVNEGIIPKKTDSGGMLTETDREFLEKQGMELAPGPKELMNMQRFYLYLNLTKPSELLCLSYSQTTGKGEATGPAYLIHSIEHLFPEIKIHVAETPDTQMDLLETPDTALAYVVGGLSEQQKRKDNRYFEELYSWYLRSPEYRTLIEKLTDAAFIRKPVDRISESVAKALYGEISPNGATRLEKVCACAFAHFLQYGLGVSERVEYEFKAMDMGNVMHQALENFAEELRRRKLNWSELDEDTRNTLADQCLDKVAADYGNTILQSSARNHYMIQRTRRILRRTVWALQEQLKYGDFQPEGFEVAVGGGRIDRVDILKEDGTVYVKVIDYKTGNTSFDLVSIYHGLQMQLVVYMDAVLEVEKKVHRDHQVKPAGIFYYNIKDPMIQKDLQDDLDQIDPEIMKKLKMNGLVLADDEVIHKMDSRVSSIPVSYNKNGSYRKGSSVATEREFQLLGEFVQKKVQDVTRSILAGEADVSPYEMGDRNACTYCNYRGVCGFDRKVPGYEFRRMKQFADDEIWKIMEGEAD